MVQKHVTLEIAKILKKAGYPQDIYDSTAFIEGDVNKMQEALVLPTYIDVWLWLWREKHETIDIIVYYQNRALTHINGELKDFVDPEEAIIAGINHLVSNKLIK